MRLIVVLVVLLVLACGAVFGALNSTRIPIDFYFVRIELSTGVALLCALLAGWLLGGAVAWSAQLRLRGRQRATRRSLAATDGHAP